MNLNAIFAEPTAKLELTQFAQIISESLMQALQQSAAESGMSLELEVLSRLCVTCVEPESFDCLNVSRQILQQQFSHEAARQECQRKRDAWLYLYEVEKLKLFLSFQSQLPRQVRENFVAIDVKAELKKLEQEQKDH